jgi:hypothetical protein
VLTVGLGNSFPTVRLLAPGGAELDRAALGPGMSDRFRVDSAAAGTYTLRAPGVVGQIQVSP